MPRWIPLVLVAGVVSFFFPVNEGIGAAVMWVAFASLGLRLVRADGLAGAEPEPAVA